MPRNKQTVEQNPYFPSGEWEGFYLYSSGPDAARHPMAFRLNFRDGKVTGTGTDDVGPFSWRGSYDVVSLAVQLVKQYAGHTVNYRGIADDSGIYGSWELTFARGGFHIWPKKEERENQQAEVEKKSKKLAAT